MTGEPMIQYVNTRIGNLRVQDEMWGRYSFACPQDTAHGWPLPVMLPAQRCRGRAARLRYSAR